MANQSNLVCVSMEAAADMSAHQFKFCKVTADNTVGLVAAATDVALGVLQTNPDHAGAAVTVAVGGTTKVKAGATVAAGAKVQPNAAGLAITATTGGTAVGICKAGGASGELIEVILGAGAGNVG